EAGLAGPATDVGGVRRQAGQVRLRAVHANGFALEAGGTAGGLVVSSVTFCRGWQLAIDGRRAEPVRGNAGFLGLLMPPAAHPAPLESRPAGGGGGLRLCALTIAAAVTALLAAGWRAARRRRPPGPAAPA